MNTQAEAKQLNIRLEQDNGEWIAILANHPDLKGDEEVGFPAPSEDEALAEARAYRSIEQSSVFKFEYDEARDEYVVSFADKQHRGKLLASTYAEAQKAYAAMINEAEPPKPEPAPVPKQTRQRKPKAQPGVPADAPQIVPNPPPAPMPPPAANITSGIGTGPGQLAPSVSHEDIRREARPLPPGTPGNNQWEVLGKRIDHLEDILRDALKATAKALEELNKR
jgi:hypothetical protein